MLLASLQTGGQLMRPIKLTLQAFGPFAERQEIDFRNSLDQRLFGFYGETGGGKTFDLRRPYFALFGEVIWFERQGRRPALSPRRPRNRDGCRVSF